MKNRRVTGLIPILICVAVILPACSYYYEHNPRLAIASASEFCDAAFVNKDFATAYVKLTPSKSEDFNLPSFVEMVNSMHPDGIFPSTTKPIGYEIVPGQGLIHVDLKGQLPDRSNYYRIVLSLDRSKAYFITALYRRDDAFEQSGFYKAL